MTVLAALLAATTTFGAPLSTPADSSGLRQDMMKDITVLEQKVVSLAQAMDASQYGWTPMEGVRTVRQVYLHIAVNNYVFPTMTGTQPPEGVKVGGNADITAFENADLSKDEVVQELKKSFAHLKAALNQAGDLDRNVSFFGRSASARWVWLEAVTHIHEHLGQAIAYARVNHVVPPWSR